MKTEKNTHKLSVTPPRKPVDERGCAWQLFFFLVGLTAAVAAVRIGPVDGVRTLYDQLIGDGPLLKVELVDYCERALLREMAGAAPGDVQNELARRLGTSLEGGRVVPAHVSTERLWDLSERLAPGWYERWIWPSL